MTKLSIPVSNGVISPTKIAIPLIPLLKISCGTKNALNAKAIIKEPTTTIRFFNNMTAPFFHKKTRPLRTSFSSTRIFSSQMI